MIQAYNNSEGYSWATKFKALHEQRDRRRRAILAPINHDNNHWSLVVINIDAGCIRHYDSLPSQARDVEVLDVLQT